MACEVKQLFSWDTQYNADSVEFCPVEPYQEYLVVGTYQLMDQEHRLEVCAQVNHENTTEVESSLQKCDAPKKRLGRLYLKQMTEEKKLVLVQQIDMPAILDMKWCHNKIENDPVLAIANASGHLLLYKLQPIDDGTVRLKFWIKSEIDEEDTLALSLDWSTGKIQCENPLISLSDSKGKISLLQLSNQELILQDRFLAHEFEAWITAFDYWNPNIVYTGGDDCKFRRYDVRNEPANPTLTSRVHSAGVTSIHSSAHSEYLLASGSYDEIVNLWDTRTMRSPCSSISLSGGIWRLKWDPQGRNLLLAACMHNGFHVTDTSPSDVQVVASFTEHESLAYGVDWWAGATDATSVIASASFYDHLLCLWEFTIN
ncbi:diphthine methyltransferase-like isoform X2 [Homarus americanus]|uniref:Diphthine methyltransferase-like n=2 Tax=Homarus americanus TaxID=6706 RepID=A0A8J5N193_HOMAM|nr:diphthine methyltransferase-like isoform X2 [Homarus americanus]XP_042217789.1 diphthine methyltransferase-like isoform X2 [Homarus americanus]KAG7171307.1 Diphthine methyltransferase-like [Homarus americanus]